MKYVRIKPSFLDGNIKIPPSKSLSHRAVICASLADGKSHIDNVQFSKDIEATIEGMRKLGSRITINKNSLDIEGNSGIINRLKSDNFINCNESGSTIRFLIPLSLVNYNKVTFTGKGKLVTRPLDVYYEIFKSQNIKYYNDDNKLPFTVEGELQPGIFKVKGNISSQFITGLLYSLPLLKGDSKIIITTDLESKGYVDLTLDTLSKFGVNIINNDYKEFIVKGCQSYKSTDYTVEGDYSQAAFFFSAGLLGSNVICENLELNSLQGDRIFLKLIEDMGADVIFHENSSIQVKPSRTHGIDIDASQCPDLVPILAATAALSEGNTRIFNAQRVRLKECDRLSAITCELKKLGADIEETNDGLLIKGKEKLNGGIVESHNDHRIAMALSIAAARCHKDVIINDSECIKKSYPEFWNELKRLGGCLDEQYVR